MKKGVKSNFGEEPYQFQVDVYDRVFKQTVTSTVSVVVKDLSEEAVLNSGALRLEGLYIISLSAAFLYGIVQAYHLVYQLRLVVSAFMIPLLL